MIQVEQPAGENIQEQGNQGHIENVLLTDLRSSLAEETRVAIQVATSMLEHFSEVQEGFLMNTHVMKQVSHLGMAACAQLLHKEKAFEKAIKAMWDSLETSVSKQMVKMQETIEELVFEGGDKYQKEIEDISRSVQEFCNDMSITKSESEAKFSTTLTKNLKLQQPAKVEKFEGIIDLIYPKCWFNINHGFFECNETNTHLFRVQSFEEDCFLSKFKSRYNYNAGPQNSIVRFCPKSKTIKEEIILRTEVDISNTCLIDFALDKKFNILARNYGNSFFFGKLRAMEVIDMPAYSARRPVLRSLLYAVENLLSDCQQIEGLLYFGKPASGPGI